MAAETDDGAQRGADDPDQPVACPPIERLRRVMAQLRDPQRGCPWDREQDFASIAPYTVEEAYEVQDAIERGDWGDLREELGDLLLQVVFHAQMAEEQGLFDFDAVASAIADKLERRHPHVFGAATAADADAVGEIWERQKAAERARKSGAEGSLMDGVTAALPAMQRAVKIQARAARAGFDWAEPAPVLAKVREETDELCAALGDGEAPEVVAGELGDVLFACANLARHLRLDPECALRATNDKFARRFRYLEARARARGGELADFDLEQQEAWWQAAKVEEGGG